IFTRATVVSGARPRPESIGGHGPKLRSLNACSLYTRLNTGLNTHGQKACDMKRFAAGAVLDLMPAGRAVRDDDRVGSGLADGRQERQLPHLERHVDRIGAVAKGTGHAAAAR